MPKYNYYLVGETKYVYAESKSKAVVMYAEKYDLGDEDRVTVYEVDKNTVVANNLRGYDVRLEQCVIDYNTPDFIEIPSYRY